VDFGLDIETNQAQQIYEILENIGKDSDEQSGV